MECITICLAFNIQMDNWIDTVCIDETGRQYY